MRLTEIKLKKEFSGCIGAISFNYSIGLSLYLCFNRFGVIVFRDCGIYNQKYYSIFTNPQRTNKIYFICG